MNDLRTAAQQALEALEYAEANHGGDDCYADSITALKAALAEPVQEPVAWLVTDCIGERYLCFSPPLDNDQVLPLYAAPPQRKPLTEEEIDSVWDSEKAFPDIYAIARAIEAKHGIMP